MHPTRHQPRVICTRDRRGGEFEVSTKFSASCRKLHGEKGVSPFAPLCFGKYTTQIPHMGSVVLMTADPYVVRQSLNEISWILADTLLGLSNALVQSLLASNCIEFA